MPTCRPSALRSPAATFRSRRNGRTHLSGPGSCIGRKDASTAVAFAQPPPGAQSSDRDQSSVRTILHKTDSFLPRVLSLYDDPSKTTSLKFWQGVLTQTYHDLNAAASKQAARVVGMLRYDSRRKDYCGS